VIFGNWIGCPLSAEYLQSVIRKWVEKKGFICRVSILLSEVLSLKKKEKKKKKKGVSFSAEVVIVHCFSIFIQVI
jgi:hypothetical protein